MSPDDYLKYLQSQRAKRVYDYPIEVMRDYIITKRPDLVVDVIDVDAMTANVFQQISNNYGPLDFVLQDLKSKLLLTCSEFERKQLGQIPVGSIYTDDPNGWVISTPMGVPVIGIHTGVMHLCYYTSRAIVSFYRIDDKGATTQISLPEDACREIVLRYVNACLVLLGDRRQETIRNSHNALDARQKHFSDHLCSSMEMFILGHEFGHVRIGHLQSIRLCSALDKVRCFTTTSHKEEFDADAWSQERMSWIKHNEDAIPAEECWLVSGGVAVFSAFRIIEKIIELLPDIAPDLDRSSDLGGFNAATGTHPPSLDRRRALLGKLSDSFSLEDADYIDAEEICRLMDRITLQFEDLDR